MGRPYLEVLHPFLFQPRSSFPGRSRSQCAKILLRKMRVMPIHAFLSSRFPSVSTLQAVPSLSGKVTWQPNNPLTFSNRRLMSVPIQNPDLKSNPTNNPNPFAEHK